MTVDDTVVLLVDPEGGTVVLAADTQVTLAMAQDDDVLDGDLRPGALVFVTAGGRTGWVTVNAVG